MKGLVLALLTLALCLPGRALPEPNLSDSKQRIRTYHDSGDWDREQREVVEECRRFLERRLATRPPRPALVLDVDETAITAWAEELATDFGYVPEHWIEWEKKADAPAIGPVLELYKYARAQGVAIFFITGRKESSRAWTEQNLRSAGYSEFEGLYLKPPGYKDHSIVPLKAGARRDIQARGYTILANLGDQQSDLDGGEAEACFKLPNPIYILP